MAMSQLGRVTLGFTGDRFDTQFIDLTCGSRRKHYLVLQLCKEGKPERIILEHIQHTGNTYLATLCLVCR